jgi:hypothetical protein
MAPTEQGNGASAPTYDIPKECKAGVVVNEGPDFRVEVQMVPVPEIGEEEMTYIRSSLWELLRSDSTLSRT